MTIERLAESARTRRLARRASIEQQAIGDASVVRDPRQVGLRLNRKHLHHRKREALTDRGDALRCLVTVKLEHVRLERIDDVFQQSIVGIDGECDFPRTASDALAKRSRGLERYTA